MDDWTRKSLARFVADQCVINYENYDEATKQSIREIGVRNMLILQRLQALLEKLQEKEIPVIVMKGCHLIQMIYPFGIRPIEDIDLLLDRKHYTAADDALNSLGYKDRALGMDVWTHIEISNKMTFMNGKQPAIPIDLHFTLGPYPYLGRIPIEALVESSEPLISTEMSINVLQVDMLLVHLLLHLFQHHDEHWEVSAYDASTLTKLRHDSIQWSRFVSLISTYSLKLPILHSLNKAAQITEIHIPASILQDIHALPISRKEQRIFNASLTMINGMEKHVIQLLTLPSFKLKLQCMQRIVLPQRTFLQYYYKGSYTRYVVAMGRTAIRVLLKNSKTLFSK